MASEVNDQWRIKLEKLRVVDIKLELSKRDLDVKGVKSILVERLKAAFIEEGLDPESYSFEKNAPMTKKADDSRDEEDLAETSVEAAECEETVEEEGEDAEDPQQQSKLVEDAYCASLDIALDDDDNSLFKDQDFMETLDSKAVVDGCDAADSPPPPESVPVVQPLTVQETLRLVDSCRRAHPLSDDLSMIVNLDATSERADDLASLVDDDDPALTNGSVPASSVTENSGDDSGTQAQSEQEKQPEVSVETPASSSELQQEESADLGQEPAEVDSKSDSRSAAGDEGQVSGTAAACVETSEVASAEQPAEDDAAVDVSQDQTEKEKDGDSTAGDNNAAKTNKDESVDSKRDGDDKKPDANKDSEKCKRNLWVSGLSSATRATDLKTAFSKCGKVIGAKIVTNARTPGARCYGYVTMATAEAADKCLKEMHKTELHGRLIKVERSRDGGGPTRREPASSGRSSSNTPRRHSVSRSQDRRGSASGSVTSDSKAKADPSKTADNSETAAGKSGDEPSSNGRASDKEDAAGSAKGRDEDSANRGRRGDSGRGRARSHHGGGLRGRGGVLTFQQIKEERERQRAREHERHLRELERRRRDDMMRAREQGRRNRQEAFRLEKERERLRSERERIEREKHELMRLERERQRAEREKLEREREELRRAALRIHDAKRSIKRPATDDHHHSQFQPDRKRSSTSTVMAPPPPAISSGRGAVYDDRRYAASSRSSASVAGRQEYPRSEDRRVSERSSDHHRYELSASSSSSRREEYRREDRAADYRSSRDGYESKSGSGRQYSDRAGGSWHSGSSAPRGGVSSSSAGVTNGQSSQRDYGWSSGKMDSSSSHWSLGSSSAGGRWASGSTVGMSSADMAAAAAYISAASMNPLTSGMYGAAADSSRYDSYKMHSSQRRY